MDIGSIATGGSTDSSAALRSLTEDFDTFLTLLTTQLENQDPLSPMDSTEFTNQLVQFSSLEQQITQTGKLDDLLASQTAAQNAAAVGYLGKTVQAKAPFTELKNGSATTQYEIPVGAAAVSIAIVDSGGNLLKVEDLDPAVTTGEFVWDGTDQNGLQQPDGTYSISLIAMNADGAPMDGAVTLFTATAEEVVVENGTLTLQVGGAAVPLSDIVSIKSDS